MSYFRPKMAVPRELQTDYEMMVTANLLMAASIESLKRKDEQLEAENTKLREMCAELLKMTERHDPEWLHWPEMHDELQKLGVKIVKL